MRKENRNEKKKNREKKRKNGIEKRELFILFFLYRTLER